MDTITTIPSLLMCNGSARPVTVSLTPESERLIAAAPELKQEVGRMVSVLENVIPRLRNVHAIMARELEMDLARLRNLLAKAEK